MEGTTGTWGQTQQFQCQLCGLSANGKGQLLSHLKECSEQQMKVLFEANKCLQCRNAFLSKELLLVHINTCSVEQLESLRQMEAINRMSQAQAMMSAQNRLHSDNGAPKMKREDGKSDHAADEMINPKVEQKDQDNDEQSNYGSENASDDLPQSPSVSGSKSKGENLIDAATKYEDNQYQCPSCDKSYSSENLLKNHNENAHLGKFGFQCNICGKKLFNSSVLQKHDETVHQGRKAYKCSSCEKTFSDKGSMKRHEKGIHEGRKDFKTEAIEKDTEIDNTKPKKLFETADKAFKSSVDENVDFENENEDDLGEKATF